MQVVMGLLSLKGLGEDQFSPLLVVATIPWLVTASLQSLPLIPVPPSLLCLSSFPLPVSYNTLVMAFGTHPGNLILRSFT